MNVKWKIKLERDDPDYEDLAVYSKFKFTILVIPCIKKCKKSINIRLVFIQDIEGVLFAKKKRLRNSNYLIYKSVIIS